MKPQAQLNINFSDGDNPLRTRLREGRFCLIVEFNAPLREQPFDSAVALGRTLARTVKSSPLVAAMAVTDRLRGEDSHDPVDVAAALADACGKPVLLHISGKGSSPERIRDILARADSAGISNLLAVTGDRSDKHPPQRSFYGLPKHPVGYMDSLDIVRLARESGHPFTVAAGVNPYKYNPADQYLQYFKMLRKLGSGAEFLVTHVGWDMKKLQELQWFLQMRDVQVPVIARTALLSADDINRLQDSLFPGVTLSRAFIAMLQRESEVNATQSMAAQLQRLGLQIIGSRLLGYSGVQLAGIRDERTLEMVLKRATEMLARETDYASWTAEWLEHHSTAEFSPLAGAYYVFRNLMTPQQQMYRAENCPLVEQPFPEAAQRDRLRSRLTSTLLSRHLPEAVRDACRAVLCRGCPNQKCHLEFCFHLCPAACPKNLVYGACGGSAPDGTCEFGHDKCFFHRVLAVAARRHQLDRLEEAVSSD
jgi:methylenetetrahydrofolate reductase (NADPH)